MKLNKKQRSILITSLIVALLAMTGIVLAATGIANNKEKSVTRPYSSVFFQEAEIDKNNEQEKDAYEKVDVYLGMHDTASIASFQIGLEVDIADCYDSSFVWNNELIEKGTPALNEVRVTEQNKDETTGNIEERMNLYYVGTKELNQLTTSMDLDNVKIGTIYVKPHKEGETQSEVRSSAVAIQTIEGASKTASLSHTSEEIKVIADELYQGSIRIKQAPTLGSFEATVESDVVDQEVKGSKITANFEVSDDTEALTNVEVRLYKEGQDDPVTTKTISKENLEKEVPVEFTGLEEGTYKVEVYITYTTDDGQSHTDKVAEEPNLQVLATDEEDDPSPEVSSSPETTPSTDSTTSPEVSSSPETSPSTDPTPSDEPTTSPETSTSPEVSSSPETSTEPSTNPETSSSPEASPEASGNPEVSPGTASGSGSGSETDGGNGGDSGNSNQGGNSGSSSNGSGSTTNGKNGWSAEDPEKGGGILNAIENAWKTGANRSVIWAVTAVIVLTVVATAIVMIKKKQNKNK